MSRGLLVTGTDTAVGKTFVGCALAAALSRRMRIAVFKPAETGCVQRDGELEPEDAVRLRAAAGYETSLELVCPYRYAEPLAPWVAAKRASRPIDPDRLRECYERLAASADFALVEGAGGLLVPLTRTYSFADLAADLDLPLVLVVGSKLGCLNHALLTIECARSRGLRVLGYVLNELARDADLTRATNPEALAQLADVPLLGHLPFVENAAQLGRERLADVGTPLVSALLDVWT